MARSRNLKPGFFVNDQLAELPPLVRLLFAGLWTIADRAGRLEDRPKKIKAQILPYDEIKVEVGLDMLEATGFLQRYEANNDKYIQIVSFSKHQNPHKNEAPSTIPAPEQHSTSTVQAPKQHATNPADSLFLDSLNPITDSLQEQKQTAPRKRVAADKGTRITKDWQPGQDLLAWVRKDFPAINLQNAVSEFVDYWIGVPGQRGRKLDWDATFRNKVRNGTHRQNGNGTARETLSARTAREADEARRRVLERSGGVGQFDPMAAVD